MEQAHGDSRGPRDYSSDPAPSDIETVYQGKVGSRKPVGVELALSTFNHCLVSACHFLTLSLPGC
jgi:hypothetical protein